MNKALAILGIVGVALAALLAFAVSGDLVPVVVLLFMLVAGVMLLLTPGGLAKTLGVITILLGLSALLYYNPITGNNGTQYLPALPDFFHAGYMPVLVVLGVVAVLVAARDAVEPAWTGYIGLGAAVLAIVFLAFLVPATQFGNFASPFGIGAAVLVLILLIPLIALLRGPPATVAPTVRQGTPAPTARTLRK
jgi:hypothetical protein